MNAEKWEFRRGMRKRVFAALLVLTGLLFGYLMGIRTGIFHSSDTVGSRAAVALEEREFWLNIYQEDEKIGYAHRRIEHRDIGYYLTDFTRMKLNTMGLVHTVEIRTTANLLPDMSLDTLDFSLNSHRFSFQAQARVKDGAFIATVGEREIRIPVEGPIYASAAAFDAVGAAELKPGGSMELPVFDPSSLSRQTVRITAVGRESIQSMERIVDAMKVRLEIKGASVTAWLDRDGSVLQEQGLLGFTLKRVSPEEALGGQRLLSGKDLTRLASVFAGRTIDKPESLSVLKLMIQGQGDSLWLDGDRQEFRNGILTVLREIVPDPDRVEEAEVKEFLESEPLIESDHPEIKRLSMEIVSDAKKPLEKARKLVSWVHDNIEKKPVISVPSALETLRHRQGDCNEHATLLAALARASGIPAQVEAGLVYLNGRFYYHAWNVLYIGGWITADALMNQMPADVTHLRMVRGDSRRQVDLLGTIGRISLNILETKP